MSGQNVFPLRYFDDTPLWRAFILYYMFVFDSVLDPEKLKSSLDLLVRHDGWKKFGARIRKNPKGNLEYHFREVTGADENYNVISYNHVVHKITAAQHDIACAIPESATERPAVAADPDKFEDLFRPNDGPTKLDDYLNSDAPQIGLYVVSFLDKTFVTVYFPHTLMDGMSMTPFLEAWTLALQGRVSEIQSPISSEGPGTFCDPLDEFSMEPTVKHVLANHQISIAGLMGWSVRNISSFFSSPENRMVCVPASTMTRLHEEATVESSADRTGNEPAAFLSDGDLLCAWWTKLLLATTGVPQKPNQPIVLNNAYSLRKVLFDPRGGSGGDESLETVPCPNTIIVSNLAAFFNVILTAGDVLQQPLYRTALASKELLFPALARAALICLVLTNEWINCLASPQLILDALVRTALTSQRTRPQAEAFLYMWRNSWGKTPPIFGSWNMELITYSNWTQAKLFDIDFTAAAVEETERAVRPVYVQNNQFGLKLPNAFPIMGKDRGGNYWLSGYLKKGHWGRIEAQLGIHGGPS